ncbi:unnamed protein product [Ceratitis capitata]|uniref:(Mediterranean fruit fly) hypothetical protein n=1 Tax=Ceratitis capitata TaxID=7213 RepID=A0A811VDL4_CERCA|nr:unnamed protein product [Ceratitis capitata]
MKIKYQHYAHFCGVTASYTVRGLLGVISSSLNIILCSLALLYQDVIEKVLMESGDGKHLQIYYLLKVFIAAFWICIIISSCQLFVSICFMLGCYQFSTPKTKSVLVKRKPKATVGSKSSAALLKSSATPAPPAAPALAPVPTQKLTV